MTGGRVRSDRPWGISFRNRSRDAYLMYLLHLPMVEIQPRRCPLSSWLLAGDRAVPGRTRWDTRRIRHRGRAADADPTGVHHRQRQPDGWRSHVLILVRASLTTVCALTD